MLSLLSIGARGRGSFLPHGHPDTMAETPARFNAVRDCIGPHPVATAVP